MSARSNLSVKDKLSFLPEASALIQSNMIQIQEDTAHLPS